MSRSLDDLLPELKEKALLFSDKMKEKKINFAFTCTYRSQEEQNALYAQGRKTLAEVNELRKIAGMYLLKEEKENKVVTHAKVSKHTSRKAFDIVILDGKKTVWDLKVDVNKDEQPDYIQAGKIGQEIGLRWGGDFNGNGKIEDESFVDMPHYELV
jgi:peptidoglycan L-alanyl-D-glutamate endopeptidase CwlK